MLGHVSRISTQALYYFGSPDDISLAMLAVILMRILTQPCKPSIVLLPFDIRSAQQGIDLLLPFSYSKVYKTPLSGQLFLLHCGLPWHGNL